LFDFATVDKALKDSRIVREGVSSSHINQILADAFKQVRDEQLKALQSGKLKPVEPGKTYSAEDLEANQASEDQFKQTIVQPKLEAAYAFYLSIMAQRDEVRAEKKKDPQAEAKQAVALNLIEQQRQFLNTALHTYVPTIVDKLGEIPPAVGTNLPFSFRDGVLVKFRLEKQVNGAVQRITLYPRMIMNQLNDEDTFFLEALRSWRDFAKVQYQAAQDAKDSYSVVNWLYGTGDLVAQVPLRQAAYEQSERDLKEAAIVSGIAKKLSESELLSLMDLFRQFEQGNIPQCEGVIKDFNKQIQTQLNGQSSNSSKFTAAQRKSIDQKAKDVVFYQDVYQDFSQAAAITLQRVSTAAAIKKP
jgi:hypothetical protein